MLKVHDLITDATRTYEDVEDFKNGERSEFDSSVWGEIDQLAEAYTSGDYTGDLESYLAIRIQ